MPWKTDDEKIEGLPPEARSLWCKVANEALAKYNDDVKAMMTAWSVVEKAGYKKHEGKYVKEAMTMIINNLKAKINKLSALKESFRHKILIDEATRLVEGGGGDDAMTGMISKIDKAINHCLRLQGDVKHKESAAEESFDFDVINLAEATMDEEKKIATITVIKAGFNSSRSKYYPAQVLKESVGMLKGVKMYENHLTEAEEKAAGGQPRKVSEWVGTIQEAWWNEATQEIKAKVKIIKESFWSLLKEAKEDMGVSINALGLAVIGKIKDVATKIIESLKKYKSVDFVTEAGAGGRVELLENEDGAAIAYEELTVEGLAEHRPDLIKAMQEAAEPKIEWKKIGSRFVMVTEGGAGSGRYPAGSGKANERTMQVYSKVAGTNDYTKSEQKYQAGEKSGTVAGRSAAMTEIRKDDRFDWTRKPETMADMRSQKMDEDMQKMVDKLNVVPVAEKDFFSPNATPTIKDMVYVAKVGNSHILVNTEGYNYPRYAIRIESGTNKRTNIDPSNKYSRGELNQRASNRAKFITMFKQGDDSEELYRKINGKFIKV